MTGTNRLEIHVKLLRENLKGQPANRDRIPGMAENCLFSTGNMLAAPYQEN
jgi:hypothetical protein